MDKKEYQEKLSEINRLIAVEDYNSAAQVADSIDWKRVRNVQTLLMISEIYEAVNRYQDSKILLLRAYRRSPLGRTVLYRLVECTIALKQFDEAIEYYSEYVQAAPRDNNKYILKYKIYRGRGSSLDEQINILKEYLDQEKDSERWSYELAKLYKEAGRMQECINTCDDLVLWYQSGKYVIKALELKKKIAPLTPRQQEIYDNRFAAEEQEDYDTDMETEASYLRQARAERASLQQDAIKSELAQDISRAAKQKEEKMALAAASSQTPLRDAAETKVIPPVGAPEVSPAAAPEVRTGAAEASEIHAETAEAAKTDDQAGAGAAAEQSVQISSGMTEAQENQTLADPESAAPEETVPEAAGEEKGAGSGMDRGIHYNEEELRKNVAESMKSIIEGVGPRAEVDEEQAQLDRVIEQSKEDQEAAVASRGLGLTAAMQRESQKKPEAPKLTIDDILLSMGERGDSVRKAVAGAEEEEKPAESEAAEAPAAEAEQEMTAGLAAQSATAETPQENLEAQPETAETLLEDTEEKSEEAGIQPEEPAEQQESEEVQPEESAEQQKSGEVQPEEPAEQQKSVEVQPEEPAEQQKSVEVQPEESAEQQKSVEVQPEELAELQESGETQTAPDRPEGEEAADQEEKPAEEKPLEEKRAPSVENILEAKTRVLPTEEIARLHEEFLRKENLARTAGQRMAEKIAAEAEAQAKSENESREAAGTERIPEAAEEASEVSKTQQPAEEAAAAAPEAGQSAEETAVTEAEAAKVQKQDPAEAGKAEEETFAENAPAGTQVMKEVHAEASVEEPQYTKEAGRKAFLKPYQRNLFRGFLEIGNLEEQIAKAIDQAESKGDDRTSRSGNVLILGGHGCGKTTIATGIAKAVAEDKGTHSVKMAKIYAADLNRKDIAATIAKIAGGVLIIEEAGDLEDSIVDQLTTAMEFRTDGMIMILEDEQRYIHDLLMRHPRFTMKFTAQIYIPAFTSAELVNFGELYAESRDCVFSEDAKKALTGRLDAAAKSGEAVSITNVIELADRAIRNSGKFFRRIQSSKKRYDDQNRVILRAKDLH